MWLARGSAGSPWGWASGSRWLRARWAVPRWGSFAWPATGPVRAGGRGCRICLSASSPADPTAASGSVCLPASRAARAADARVPATALKVTQRRVLHSEFTKFRSLRSTVYTLLAAVVLMIGIGALFSAVTASQYHTFSAADRARFNPVTASLNGVIFAVVAFGVLGVLLMSGGDGTGMIRASPTAVPPRPPVLWGKLAAFPGPIFSASLIASFISFFLGQALLSSHHLGVSIAAPDA